MTEPFSSRAGNPALLDTARRPRLLRTIVSWPGISQPVDRSEWVENYVSERLQRLDKFAQGITRCHVTLTREHGSQQKGNRYSVMVEVRVPPQHDLAVKKQKEIQDMQTQLPAVINQAFGAIERQLKKTAALRR